VTAEGVTLQPATRGIMGIISEIDLIVGLAGGTIKRFYALHDGQFHADDVFVAAVLGILSPGAILYRGRNTELLKLAAFVADVGGVWDEEANRYDHHQWGPRDWEKGVGVRPNGVPYASFGLVWRHLGFAFDVIGSVLQGGDSYREVARLVDERLVQAVDAADVAWQTRGTGVSADTTPRYSVSAAISAFNPGWNETEETEAAFVRAVEFASQILRREIARAYGEVLAVAQVRAALAQQANEPAILVLNHFVPWQATVIAEAPDCQFVVFPSEDGQWRVQVVPQALDSFEPRRPLPAAWGAKRGADLAAAVRADGGILGDEEAVFCHAGRFICGATSFEGAMQMARTALSPVLIPA